MDSFRKALDLGCDEVETDVWLAADGRLLVSHDPPQRDAGLMLEEVLAFCRGRMGVNVELKSVASEARAGETGARVAEVLTAQRDPDVYVSSFWWDALEGSRSAGPGVRRAFLFSDSPDRRALLDSARAAGLWALHPNREYVTADLVRDVHGAGLVVNAWTVNEPREIAQFRDWGVDGIISDYPERVPKD